MKHGNILKRMREMGKASQRDMSRKLSIDVSYLSRCENDKQPYTLSEDLIIKYAKALNLDSWPWLFEAKRFPSEIAEEILKSKPLFDFLCILVSIDKNLLESYLTSYGGNIVYDLKDFVKRNSP